LYSHLYWVRFSADYRICFKEYYAYHVKNELEISTNSFISFLTLPTDPDVQDYRIRFLDSDSFDQTRNQSGETPIGA